MTFFVRRKSPFNLDVQFPPSINQNNEPDGKKREGGGENLANMWKKFIMFESMQENNILI